MPPVEPHIDAITKRPRTPNTQYSCLTEKQIDNIATDWNTLFDYQVKTQSENDKRWTRDRYVNSYSPNLLRDQAPNQSLCWVGEKHSRFPPVKYDTCRRLASEKWGTYKCGKRTAGYSYGQPTDMYTEIDMYRRNPTNQPGPTCMDFGRPSEGYYSQKYPSHTTWNMSGVPLNQTHILQTVPKKTIPQYEAMERMTQNSLGSVKDSWPFLSEYTDTFGLRSKTEHTLNNMERRKRHLAEAAAAEVA